MAYLNPPFRYRAPAAPSEALQFQRGLEKTPVKKIQRKLTVKFRHIFLFFFILAAFFFGLMKLYLFLITWSELDVKRIQVLSRHDFMAGDIQALLDVSRLGNLLLVDIAGLQARIEGHRWVKEARLRRVFPASLKIEIKEREPAAILKVGQSFLLIDEEGVALERLAAPEETGLPLLLDSSFFSTRYKEKLALAWECLRSLTAEQRAEIAALDFSRYDSVSLYLNDRPTEIILGSEDFSPRLEFYQSFRDRLESEQGPLEYVDLRFRGRIYLKPAETQEVAALTDPKGEGK
jgi:cell division septal protein FtsQ